MIVKKKCQAELVEAPHKSKDFDKPPDGVVADVTF